VQKGKEAGLSLKEIRDQVDENYSKWATPTMTPYPPEGL
jgi:hypothetical protein